MENDRRVMIGGKKMTKVITSEKVVVVGGIFRSPEVDDELELVVRKTSIFVHKLGFQSKQSSKIHGSSCFTWFFTLTWVLTRNHLHKLNFSFDDNSHGPIAIYGHANKTEFMQKI
ncbi:hypothetical protein CTI12_AA472690 [Artemisia annua]|uniref:Uncharacterized protein n=1 Tax=Artemisia annua TaxID=35608 RepID=A0A2U1LCK3_ARTAN|nr:hypothetical protein CTI12_AA472690 [Artemisia annua]